MSRGRCICSRIRGRSDLRVCVGSERRNYYYPIYKGVDRGLRTACEEGFRSAPVQYGRAFLRTGMCGCSYRGPRYRYGIFVRSLPFTGTSRIHASTLGALILTISVFLDGRKTDGILSLLNIRVDGSAVRHLCSEVRFVSGPSIRRVKISSITVQGKRACTATVCSLESRRLVTLLSKHSNRPLGR